MKELRDHIVVVMGEVLRVSGHSLMHGPDKKFRLKDVDLSSEDRDKDLFKKLLKQGQDSE